MELRLDPRLPVVWRTPTSLQFGIDRPRLRLEGLDPASERMIAALGPGVTRAGLAVIARSAGAGDAAIDELLTRLAPVMHRSVAVVPKRVVVAGAGRLAERIAALLAESGVAVFVTRTVDAAEGQDCDLAIAIGQFVLDPGLLGVWLRRDRPHFPVVVGDSEIAIGPLVEPGVTACLYCLQRHASDADPAWPAIATQLWGRRSPAETELVTSEVGAIVTRAVLARLAGETVHSRQLLVGTDGSRRWRDLEIHPECGCVEAGAANAEARRGTGSAAAPEPRPTIGATGGGRG